MNTDQRSTLRELSEIELDQVGGGCECQSCWVHRDGTPSWLYYDCAGRAHNMHAG